MGEFIVPDVTGRLVPVARPRELAEAISGMLADPAELKHMGGAGLRRFRECYTATGNIGLIEQAYAKAQALVRPG